MLTTSRHHFDEDKMEWIPVKAPVNLGTGMSNWRAREQLRAAEQQKDTKGVINAA